MSDSEVISECDAYETSYRVFWQAIEMLSLGVVDQCNAMGNYNVAWELKDDVSAGSFLISSPACRLNLAQRQVVAELIQQLQGVPPALLVQATTAAANQSAMSHACWVSIRSKAAQVLHALPRPEA